ncbi:Queuine tRNA-ribosyltransferase [hydrothermal vent metagenome]|uniref:Queuine tRNA-ribosyltransferase n=1 Tax=hydrothermal vent metagenome TaxID=652676 RepID=A0A3B0TVE4_9ZZZZ
MSEEAGNRGIRFDIEATEGAGRVGALHLPRGTIATPAFMPVGTAAAVKAMFPDTVRGTGADVILGNTYHLMLRPGAERVGRLGGLHQFMDWPGPILTDSGGFQVMSLAALRKISENGVTFRSHLDGSAHELTPERSIEIQTLLGADISMQFDECIAYPAEKDEASRAMELSLRWGARSKAAFGAPDGRALFGIVQGGVFADLRERSALALREIGFDGYAIGGLAVGEGQHLMLETIEATVPHLPKNRPRYLMGVGTPDDLLASAMRGIDMFDCVMPTRSGRHGQAFTRFGKINLRNARFAEDTKPLDEASPCEATRRYSRAYLHHLFGAREMLGSMILSWSNIAYYQELMSGLRSALAAGEGEEYCASARQGWARGDV